MPACIGARLRGLAATRRIAERASPSQFEASAARAVDAEGIAAGAMSAATVTHCRNAVAIMTDRVVIVMGPDY
jgi:hypothetical protein